MASLKVWHWFENPKPVAERLTALSTITASSAEGYINFTGWGLPNTSVIVGAPAEYAAELRIDLRKTSSDNWARYSRSFECSSAEKSQSNLLMFMPISRGSGVYEGVYLSGTGLITLDSDNNRWRIFVQAAAYFSDGKVVAAYEGSIVNANLAAIHGVNIYY